MPKRKGAIGRRPKRKRVLLENPTNPDEGNVEGLQPVVRPVAADVSSDADSEQFVIVPATANQHDTNQVENSGHRVQRSSSPFIPNAAVGASTASVHVPQSEQLPLIVPHSSVLGRETWLNDPRISECLDRPTPGRADVPDYDSDDSCYVPRQPDSLYHAVVSQWLNDPNLNAGAGSSTAFLSDVPGTIPQVANVQIEQIPNVPQGISTAPSDAPEDVIFVRPRVPKRKRKNRHWGNKTRRTSTIPDVIPDGVPLVVDDVEVIPEVPQNNDEIPQLRNIVYPLAWCRIEEIPSTDIDVHTCGQLNSICRHCNALYFPAEKNTRGRYVHCCKDGTVCPTPLGAYPSLFLELFLGSHPKSEHFLKNIRKYNSALSFASKVAETRHVPGRPDTTFFAVHGKIHHRIANSMRPFANVAPRYAQCYVYDAEEALRQRANVDVNHDLDLDLLRELDHELRTANPFAQSYMLMRQVVEDAIERDGPDAVENIRMFFARPNPSAEIHQGRLNAPVATDVAMIFRSASGIPPAQSFCIYPVGGGLRDLPRENRYCDPLSYTLLYPSGGTGWSADLEYTFLQHYLYRFSLRENDRNMILRSRKLFQEYVVDAYAAIEAQRLRYLRTHQSDLRRDSYLGLIDYVQNRANQAGVQAGIPVILPSTFIGSPRYLNQLFQDSMAIVVRFGKPDLFITFTCNPKWPEIKDNLFPGQNYTDRPDLVARVFEIKMKAFLNDILKNNILGRVVAHMGQVEFQKRGLPHLHLLLILHTDNKIRNADDIDRVVSAEIPNKNVNRKLYDAVSSHMIHGPCGRLNPHSPCMENGKCCKQFPKKFSERTHPNDNGYPIYKRPDNGRYIIKGDVIVDNQFVVPYNWYLLLKYNAHINVEICNEFTAVKYLYKYIYKGSDMVTLTFMGDNNTHTLQYDEIRAYEMSRYVSALEAVWRIWKKHLSYRSHDVDRLSVHLPDRQSILFHPNEEDEALERAANTDTTLTGFFKLNEVDVDARQLLYIQIPERYVWIKSRHRNYWKKRQRRFNKVCRMVSVSVRDIEAYHLRILLHHVRGPKSFDDVKTYNGVLHTTFKEACLARRLLQDDREWYNAMEEAITFQMPHKLRQLFAFICIFCSPDSPLELWLRFRNDLSEDYIRRLNNDDQGYDQALTDIARLLNIHGKTLEQMGLPLVDHAVFGINDNDIYNPVQEDNEYQRAYNRFNPHQKKFFDDVMSELNGITSNGRCFHLDAFAGAGKSFVLNAILNKVRSNGGVAIAVAWSGIAATLLKGGSTAHSRFKLPFDLDETSVCRIAPTSPEGSYIRTAQIIVWDECTMTNKFAFEAVDRALRDITGVNQPFGNKIIIMSGDWRQILPVVPFGSALTVIETCIKQSHLWVHFRRYVLSINMRTNPWEVEFSNWLLKLGDGRLSNTYGLGADIIEIPTVNVASDNLIQDVYGENINNISDDDLVNTGILSSKNETVLALNEQILTKLSGDVCTYFSADTIAGSDNDQARENIQVREQYPMEYVNALTPAGMPPHSLNLKVGAVVMLLRNLDIIGGLCNGTRLIIRHMLPNLIEAEIAIGAKKGEHVFIPRMQLSPTDNRQPFILTRIQYPLRLSFAMTINKAQGQSLRKIGILLREPVFSHGMLYVAFSRATTRTSVHVAVEDSDRQGKLVAGRDNVFTPNVVFREVLH